MDKDRDSSFDYEAERAYYADPVTEVRPYGHLEGHLLAFGKDYPGLFRGKRVLDIGGGEGLHARLIAERCTPAALITMDLMLHRMLRSLPSSIR